LKLQKTHNIQLQLT